MNQAEVLYTKLSELRDENARLHKALLLASKEIASRMGTCPNDLYDWTPVCGCEVCESDLETCWKEYFMEDAE
jgi:hypothetical protein